MNAGASFLIASGLTFFQTDAAIIGTALAAQQGKLHMGAALAGCFFGGAVGDVVWFLCGRYLGKWALERRPVTWFVRPQQMAIASRWLSRRGDLLLVISRFLPGLCTAIQFMAGMLHARPRRAIPLLLTAAALNTFAVFSLAVWLGHGIETYLSAYRQAAVWIIVAAGLMLLVVLHFGPGLITSRLAKDVVKPVAGLTNADSPENTAGQS